MGTHKRGLPPLSPIEALIMDSVWQGNKTTRSIYDALPEATKRRLTFSSISTYLMRMVQKEFLTRTPISGREYEYSPRLTKEEAEEQRYKQLEPDDATMSLYLRRFAGRDVFDENQKNALHQIAEYLEEKIFGRKR